MKEKSGRINAGMDELLLALLPEQLPEFLEKQAGNLITSEKPFADYMREKIREKGILQQNVFLNANVSENYGYKLISEEKHTKQRDMLLRLCLAAHFTVEETQEALTLYGMAPLHASIPRDIIFLVAFNRKMWDIYEVNELLKRCRQKPLFKD